MLENFLRPYVELHPHVWSKRLSIAEFAANNAINVSTGYTPFFLNSGGESNVARASRDLPRVNLKPGSKGGHQSDEGSTE